MRKPKNRQAEKVSITASILARTAKAILVTYNEKERWIPLSQVHQIDDKAGIIYITPFYAKILGAL